MRVLLVYPNITGMNMLPPSIAIFSAILKERGHEVSLFDSTDYPNPEDANFDSDKSKEKNLNARPYDNSLLKVSFKEEDVFSAFLRHVSDFKPGLIAISCVEDLFPIAIDLLSGISDLEIPIIMGGVFPTFAPELVISHKEVDMICIGEGEHVLAELCGRMDKGKPYEDIPGLWVKRKDGIIRNPMGKPVDINENPPPDLSIFSEGRLYRPMQGKVWRMFPLETHRGCVFQCTFCNSPSQSSKYRSETSSSFFRAKRINRIRNDIVTFRDKYKAEALYFWADSFLSYPEKDFDEFTEMYSEFKLPFWCQTRPETVSYDRIKRLVDIGLLRMSFGIEHGNEKFRRDVLHRYVSNKKILESLKIANDLGVMFSVNNIMGFPYETRDLTFDTVELNRHIEADAYNAYSFSPFHGTPLRGVAEKEGFIGPHVIARSLTRPTLLSMPQYPAEEIEGIRRCFVFYVKMPKERWAEIRKAEEMTPEGNLAWERIRQECAEKYIKF